MDKMFIAHTKLRFKPLKQSSYNVCYFSLTLKKLSVCTQNRLTYDSQNKQRVIS